MRLVMLLTWTLATTIIVLFGISDAAEIIAGEILIEANALHPEVLMTEPEHRVLFTNRSGRSVHIQFSMKNQNGYQHHLVQVSEQIWAIFHQVGRHPFVVHFGDPSMANLYGAVEVVGDPYGRPDPLVCSGITVMGACLER
jgi:hypothetical protein